jgi:hypothetical protein
MNGEKPMIDDFAKKIIDTLMDGMEAIDKDGNIDFRSRLSASKQSVDFFGKLIDGMTPVQKQDLSEKLSNDMIEKIKASEQEEEKFKEILEERKEKRHEQQSRKQK